MTMIGLRLRSKRSAVWRASGRAILEAWRLPVGAALLLACCAGAAAQDQPVLQDIVYSSGAAGQVELRLRIDGSPPEPRSFVTESPPRIAVDLPGTANAWAKGSMDLGPGTATKVTAVEAGGRTRVVLELSQPVEHGTSVDNGDIVVTLQGATPAAQTSGTSTPATRGGAAGAARLEKVDFRRGPDGAGRVIMQLSRTDVSIDLQREGQQVIVDMLDTAVPDKLERRLDVVDFATPVKTIDTFSRGAAVRTRITAMEDFEQLAYQADSQYVVELKRPPKEEAAPEEEEAVGFADREYTGQPVTFNFQDIPVRSVLQLIADVSNLNIVVSDSVTGSVTMRLNKVPWDQALDIILNTKGLDKRRNGNVMWVAPAEEIAAFERQQLQVAQEKQELVPLETAFIQVNYHVASEIAELLRKTVTPSTPGGLGGGQQGGNQQSLLSDRGSVTVDQRTNTLLVNDTPDRIANIRALIERLDKPVRQVLIESRIVVATSDFARDVGARFGLTGATEGDEGTLISTGGGLNTTDQMTNVGLVNRLNGNASGLPVVSPANPPGGIAVPSLNDRLNVNLPVTNPAGSLAFSILGSDYLLDLELSAMEQENRGEVVSTPRVITKNRIEATIEQGEEIPFQESTSSGATNVQFKEAKLKLEVTPTITPDDRITLSLRVTQDSRGEQTAQGPAIDTRRVETEVLIDNGETVVLGGIRQVEKTEDSQRVPWLSGIPGFGRLFRSDFKQEDRAELLIFVTPKILDETLGLR